MNEEIDQQNPQGNIYQGNYENDYKNSLVASSDVVGINLPYSTPSSTPNSKSVEAPKYMNLGAPRERDIEDLVHHENNMKAWVGTSSKADLSSLGLTAKRPENAIITPVKVGFIVRFSARYLNLHFHGPHFKLWKTDNIPPHSLSTKIKWGVIVIFISVSVGSFVTQSALYLKDRFMSGVGVAYVDANSLNQNSVASTGKAGAVVGGEFKGSDDGTNVNGSSTGPKIGGPLTYRLNDVAHFPSLSAKSFLVADLVTGEIIKESQDVSVYPLASVSKLMTGVVVAENMDPKSVAIVSKSSYNTFGTEGELLLGESIRVSDLMYPLLMESSNDGAEVLADSYGHDRFMSEMNRKARALGMNDTYYNDPSGLDPKNVSTVDDQFKLAKYIFEKDPVIFDLTRVRQFEILNHRWYSKNAMLNLDSFLGGKNGFIDESKQTSTCLFNIQLAKGGKRKVAIIILKSSDREGDVVKILNFLKKNGYYEEGASSVAGN